MALTNMSYSDDTVTVEVVWEGALTTAYVSHNLTGIHARGNAKHNPEDIYNQVVGSDLAIARAKARLYNKIQKKLAKDQSFSLNADFVHP